MDPKQQIPSSDIQESTDENLRDALAGELKDNKIVEIQFANSKLNIHTVADELLQEDEAVKPELKERLKETSKILNMALNNKFVTALNICKNSSDSDLYRSLACATLSFLRAVLTLEPSDVQDAVFALNQSLEVSSKLRRRTSTASMMMRLLYKPNYNIYSDEDCHAELVHAESLLLLALISFLSDQSIICLVKGAFRLRAGYQRYKECLYIMENKVDWSSTEAKIHFESGVRMGYGTFNLLISFLPRRVLRILEYVGFSGDRVLGIDELEKSIKINDGLRSVFSVLILLTYNSYIENLFGLGNYDLEKVRDLSDSLEAQFPQSAFYLLFRARFYQMQGELEEAIKHFELAIEAQDDWKQFHSICHWEMMWCNAVQLNWDRAAHFADLMRRTSKWSVASYQYQYGTFRYTQLVEDERAGLCKRDSKDYKSRMAEIRSIIEEVPSLRTRYAGKTLPAEKFAITRSIKFCKQNNRLTLPAIEFLYIWNVFVTLKNSPKQLEQLLVKIDSEIKYINSIINQEREAEAAAEDFSSDEAIEKDDQEEEDKKDEDEDDDGDDDDDDDDDDDATVDYWIDDLCLALLLKGMCLKHLNRLNEAEKCFKKVLMNESNIIIDTFLVPHASMELALLKLIQRKYSGSKEWIKKTRTQYTGYLHETIVHFRLHGAMRVIRLEQLESSSDSSSNSHELDELSEIVPEQQEKALQKNPLCNI